MANRRNAVADLSYLTKRGLSAIHVVLLTKDMANPA
jgi:hypothetical protein